MNVAIVTSVLNRESVIENCLESVSSQILPADVTLTHLIRDGGSSDGTFEKLTAYQIKFPDDVKIFQGLDSGLYDGLNKSLSLAKDFDLVILLHSDDVFASSDTLHNLLTFVKSVKADVYCGDVELVDGSSVNRQWIAKPELLRFWYLGLTPPHVALCYTRSALNVASNYSIQYKVSSDFDYVIRLYKSEMRFVRVDGMKVIQRTGGASAAGIHSFVTTFLEDAQILRSHGVRLHFFFSFLKKSLKLRQFKWFSNQ
jgi:glycosyltransferase